MKFLHQIVIAAIVFSGCGKGVVQDKSKKDIVSSSVVGGEDSNQSVSRKPNELLGKFEFKLKNANGEAIYYLKYDGDDGKLLDGNKEEICRYKQTESKLKILDNSQKVVGIIAAYPDRFKIEDGKGIEILEYQKSGDDWKLKNKEKMLLRIKSRDYGFELEKPDDKRYGKVKVKDGKKSLRDADENAVLYTKDKLDPEAMVPLGFKAVDARHRFGLSLAIQIRLNQ